MSYRVKEVFYSIQGEGARAGRPAVFCRFSGCNLWSGRESDRAEARCRFCDTDFLGTDGTGGGVFESASALAEHLAGFRPKADVRPYLVFTGGEPALQLDGDLLEAARESGFETAVETNGTLPLMALPDWITVSPKAGTELVVTRGDELKLVHPSAIDPESLSALEFRHFFLQPLDDGGASHVPAALAYCLEHPRWRLSVQLHKILGVR